MNEVVTKRLENSSLPDWDRSQKPRLGGLWAFQNQRLRFLEQLRQHGDIVPFKLFRNRCWLISHPDLIEQVLVTQNKKFIKHFALRYLRSFIGNGLLINEGQSWLKQRRRMQPTFMPSMIAKFSELMIEQSNKLIDGWQDLETVELHQELSRLTLAIATRSLFATDADDDASEVYEVLKEALAATNARFGSRFPIPSWIPTPGNRAIRRAIHTLQSVIDRIIRKRLDSKVLGDDLLSKLIQSRDENDATAMTSQQLRDEVLTLFLAGHGTTANALSWTLYRVGKNREILEKMRAEWKDALGDREITAADVPHLKYTQAVVQESMRLDPPAYIMGREATEDLELGERLIRTGDTIFLSQWVTQRDERWYRDPLEFRPERWLEIDSSEKNRFSYFPFGAGPRVCIGNHFALLEFPLVLATILRKIDFELIDREVEPWPLVTLRPKGPMKAKILRLD
jgi:cytochrome P450